MQLSFSSSLRSTKQIVLLIVFVVLVIATILILLQRRRPEPVASQQPSASSEGVKGKFLPFGTEFSTALFEDPQFIELKIFPPLRLDPQSLGVSNPFAIE
jgi:hypothetical protein